MEVSATISCSDIVFYTRWQGEILSNIDRDVCEFQGETLVSADLRTQIGPHCCIG